MYFRSIALFAFAACATFVSAAPAPSSLELVAARAAAQLDFEMRSVAVGADAAVIARSDEIDARAAALPAPAKVLQEMTIKLTPIVKKLKAAVADKKKLKAEEITGYLKDIVAILTLTHNELKAIVKNPAGFVTGLTSFGTILVTLGPFIQLLFTVLALVLKVVANTPLGPVVQPLLTTIAGLLTSILTVAFSLLPGLLGLLSPILAILSPILSGLGLTSLLSIINVPGLKL